MNNVEDNFLDVRVSSMSLRRGFAILFVFGCCLTQLSGCGVVNTLDSTSSNKVTRSGCDGPPSRDVDISKIKDAEPRVEKFHPYGTRSYVQRGRQYKVLKSSKGYVKKGYASWYGSKFHGLQTSTQERFNLYGMTAASPELPLPSYVQVTNLRNGKKVVVRVNDRGPFHGKRILDLSYAAAKKLGFAEHGVAPVKVVAIDPVAWAKRKPKPKAKPVQYAKSEAKQSVESDKPSGESLGSKIFLQVGAFAHYDNAERLSSKVTKLISDPIHIEHRDSLYKVHVGPLASLDDSGKLRELLEKNGFKNVRVIDS